jgi:hypothetical protein
MVMVEMQLWKRILSAVCCVTGAPIQAALPPAAACCLHPLRAARRLRWRPRSLLATTACQTCSVRTCLRCWGRRGAPTTGAMQAAARWGVAQRWWCSTGCLGCGPTHQQPGRDTVLILQLRVECLLAHAVHGQCRGTAISVGADKNLFHAAVCVGRSAILLQLPRAWRCMQCCQRIFPGDSSYCSDYVLSLLCCLLLL